MPWASSGRASWRGLIAVSEDEGLKQTNVVNRTGMDRSTLAEIFSRLVRKGLLQRRRSREDARA